MWDLPRPGLEPVSPALAGRLSTTAPPGKPSDLFSKGAILKISKKMVKYNLFFFPSEKQWITKLSEFYSQEGKKT